MCYFCGFKFSGDKVYRDTSCEKCGKDMKVCLNCRFYDEGSHWSCRESISEEVADKEKANFCEFFEYIDRAGGSLKKKSDKAKDELKKLFGSL